jgi:hypothetical protein
VTAAADCVPRPRQLRGRRCHLRDRHAGAAAGHIQGTTCRLHNSCVKSIV